eukprot:m.74584 g.74584  ORF g.74584 m.74584 type:complete len:407 (-) comp10312_c0_seq1:73-1293(-)
MSTSSTSSKTPPAIPVKKEVIRRQSDDAGDEFAEIEIPDAQGGVPPAIPLNGVPDGRSGRAMRTPFQLYYTPGQQYDGCGPNAQRAKHDRIIYSVVEEQNGEWISTPQARERARALDNGIAETRISSSLKAFSDLKYLKMKTVSGVNFFALHSAAPTPTGRPNSKDLKIRRKLTSPQADAGEAGPSSFASAAELAKKPPAPVPTSRLATSPNRAAGSASSAAPTKVTASVKNPNSKSPVRQGASSVLESPKYKSKFGNFYRGQLVKLENQLQQIEESVKPHKSEIRALQDKLAHAETVVMKHTGTKDIDPDCYPDGCEELMGAVLLVCATKNFLEEKKKDPKLEKLFKEHKSKKAYIAKINANLAELPGHQSEESSSPVASGLPPFPKRQNDGCNSSQRSKKSRSE